MSTVFIAMQPRTMLLISPLSKQKATNDVGLGGVNHSMQFELCISSDGHGQ